VEPVFGMRLEVPEDGDVAGVADLLRQVGGVVDELRPEVGVFLLLVRKPRFTATPASRSASLMKPACRASSRAISWNKLVMSLLLPRRFISL
jgi:hypothetical protein